MNYLINQSVIARLNNLIFGGKIVMKVVTNNYFTKIEQIEYAIELPCGDIFRTETILS